MQLKRGLRPLWRGPLEVQIGTDQRTCVVLRLATPVEHKVLSALEEDQSLPHLRQILVEAGGERKRADVIVGELTRTGLLVERAAPTSRWAVPEARRERLAAAAESRQVLGAYDGWAPLALRARQSVAIDGLGRTGARIAAVLADSSIGRLRLHDPRLVTRRDLSCEYHEPDFGHPRQTALRRALAAAGVACEIGPYSRNPAPDVVVTVDYEVCDLVRARELARADLPHLPVVIEEASITCGPWVVPGRSVCVQCLALHRADADPCWPAMATQQATRSVLADRGEDQTLAALAGAFAAGQVLAALAGDAPACLGVSTTFQLPDLSVTSTTWEPHPRCTCSAPPGLREAHQFLAPLGAPPKARSSAWA